MTDETHRILLAYRANFYKLATFYLRHVDGSFYLHLTRRGETSSHWQFELFGLEQRLLHPIETKEVKRKGVDVSYHSSGLIRYKNVSNKSIAAEPLNLVTQHFCFAKYSVPSIDKLDPRPCPPGSADSIIPIPDDVEGRITFSFFVSPLNDPKVVWGEVGLNILYADLFSINCVADRLPVHVPVGLTETFVFLSPTKGLRTDPLLSPDQAAIVFHQRLTGSSELIVYPPDIKGVYRIVFSVEMRIAPAVRIEFVDPQYSAEVTRSTKGSTWFRVRDANRRVMKNAVAIRGVELDARL